MLREAPPVDVTSALLAVLAAWSAQHTTRNLDAYLALFAAVPTPVLIGPEAQERCMGLAAIRAQAARDWQMTKSLTFAWTWQTGAAVETVGWVAAEGTSQLRMGGHDLEFRVRLTATLIWISDQWRITQLHLSIPVDARSD